MIGWVGNDMKDLSIALYADADFAGCAQSLRSTCLHQVLICIFRGNVLGFR